MTNFVGSELIAARVAGFKSLDPAGVAVATSGAVEARPAAASDGAGTMLILYEQGPAQDGAPSMIAARMLTTR